MQKTTPLVRWIEDVSQIYFWDNTISSSPKILIARFLRSNGLFLLLAYASLAASRTLLGQLPACFNLTLDSDLLCCYKQTKWFLWTLAAAQVAENHGHEWSLTWYLRSGIYTFRPWNNHQSFDIGRSWRSFVRQNFFTIRHNNWKSIIGKTTENFKISCSSFLYLPLACFLLLYIELNNL